MYLAPTGYCSPKLYMKALSKSGFWEDLNLPQRIKGARVQASAYWWAVIYLAPTGHCSLFIHESLVQDWYLWISLKELRDHVKVWRRSKERSSLITIWYGRGLQSEALDGYISRSSIQKDQYSFHLLYKQDNRIKILRNSTFILFLDWFLRIHLLIQFNSVISLLSGSNTLE